MKRRNMPHTRESLLALAYPEPNSGCWLWEGAIMSRGYGTVTVGQKTERAHRVIYQLERGEIQHGMHLDHKCRNRACVNPDHLEPVTPQENTRRGASFKNAGDKCWKCGHEVTRECATRPYFRCNECKKARMRSLREERKASLSQESK